MRTHSQILKDAGGYQAVAESLCLPKDRVRFWERRKRIPPAEWRRVSAAELATLEELASSATMKRGR